MLFSSSCLIVDQQGALGPDVLKMLEGLQSLKQHIKLDEFELKEELQYLLPSLLFTVSGSRANFQEPGKAPSGVKHLNSFLLEGTSGSEDVNFKLRKRIAKYFRQRDLVSISDPLADLGQKEQLSKL